MIDIEVFEDGQVNVYGGKAMLERAPIKAEAALATVLTRLTQMQLEARRLAYPAPADPTERTPSAPTVASDLAAARETIRALEATIKELHDREEKTRDAYRKEYAEAVAKGDMGLKDELARVRAQYESLQKKYDELCESVGELAREAGHEFPDD